VLAEHLNDGKTYRESADEYDDATFDSVGYWMRKYDLTANHLRPKYTGNSVPLRCVAPDEGVFRRRAVVVVLLERHEASTA
jgi:hypothetical protein